MITFGAVPALSAMEAPLAVRLLREARPDVQVMVFQRSTSGILNAVQLQQMDLGIIDMPPPLEGMKVLFRATVPCVCLVPENHHLARDPGRLDLNEAADEGLFVTCGDAFDDVALGMDEQFSRKIRRKSRLFAANMPVAAALACANGALAVVDPFSAELAIRLGGMVSRPLLQSLGYTVALVTRGKDSLSREALQLARDDRNEDCRTASRTASRPGARLTLSPEKRP